MPDPTFPGVYTQIIDQSFLPQQLSRFRPGLVGVTSKGPMNVPTVVRSLKDFLKTFGNPVTAGSLNGDTVEYYLADAVSLVAPYTSSMTVVRVGNTYTDYAGIPVSGTAAQTTFATSFAGTAILNGLRAAEPATQLWLRIQEDGKRTTVNAKVQSVVGTNVTINVPLEATYTSGNTAYSKTESAAANAESTLRSVTYGTKATEYGYITGEKNSYQFQVSTPAQAGLIQPGDVYKISTAGTNTQPDTAEIRVKMVVNGTVHIETTDDSRIGYQALPLQDSYTSDSGAFLYKKTGSADAYILKARTPGEWANGSRADQGLYVRVRPGSAPGTKRLDVYENGGLAETFDNIVKGAYADAVGNEANPISQLVYVAHEPGANAEHAANTINPWDATEAANAVNAGSVTVNSTLTATGGQFSGGFNGNNATELDYAGQYLPVEDRFTGLRSFEDTDNIDINLLVAPLNFDTLSGSATTRGMIVMQQLADTAKVANAIALCDVPPGYTSAEAVDWHNGTGRFVGRGRLDKTNLALYWNWWTMPSKFTGVYKLMPPSLAALRCFAFTFQRDHPWYAAAGETRGAVQEAVMVEYDRVSSDARNAMYGNGNSVNPILKIRNRFYVYGERTMQRAESKLTAVHSVVLINTIVKGLAEIGRRFVFDPNDLELLVQIRLAFSEYLDKIRNQRGVEEYELVVDERNNTADTRNRREVIVDLAVIPTDVMERLFINATVRESGATLNNVNA